MWPGLLLEKGRTAVSDRSRSPYRIAVSPALGIGIAAAFLGIWALIIYYRSDELLSNGDAIGHLYVARRTLDSVTPSFAQLGTIWLPLPHVLMLPLIWDDTLWHTGLAGSFVSLLSFVFATVYVFKIASALTRSSLAAVLTTALFATNPSMLYMQATPMSEALTLCLLVGAVYHLLRWIQYEQLTHFLLSAGFVLAGTLTRFESWALLPAGLAVIAAVTYARSKDFRRVEGMTIAWGAVASYGIVLWLIYNQMVFGNAFAFASGKGTGAQLASDLRSNGLLPTDGHAIVSVYTYGWAVLDNVGLPMAIAATAGFALMMASRAPLGLKLAVVLPASIFLFEVASLTAGQNVLWTPHTTPAGFYNLRYGLLMLPAAVISASCLARASRFVGPVVLLVLLVPQLAALPGASLKAPDPLANVNYVGGPRDAHIDAALARSWTSANYPLPGRTGPITLAEAALAGRFGNIELGEAPAWLQQYASAGKILMSELHGASSLMLYSQLPLSHFIYEGNTPYFKEEIARPGTRAEWLISQPDDQRDGLFSVVKNGPPAGFDLVFDNEAFRIFRRMADFGLVRPPSGVPPDAHPVRHATVLGRLGAPSRRLLDVNCNDGLVTVATTEEHLFLSMSCARASSLRLYVGEPIRISMRRFGVTVVDVEGPNQASTELIAEGAWLVPNR